MLRSVRLALGLFSRGKFGSVVSSCNGVDVQVHSQLPYWIWDYVHALLLLMLWCAWTWIMLWLLIMQVVLCLWLPWCSKVDFQEQIVECGCHLWVDWLTCMNQSWRPLTTSISLFLMIQWLGEGVFEPWTSLLEMPENVNSARKLLVHFSILHQYHVSKSDPLLNIT